MRHATESSRHFLVTGAATGIGAAVATRLAADGHRVSGAGLDPIDGSAAAQQWSMSARSTGAAGTFTFSELDVTNEQAVLKFYTDLDPIDGLVNCAGIYPPEQRLEDVSLTDFRHVMDVNLVGTFLMCRAVLPRLRSRGGGAIVNISSVHAISAANGQGVYAASKAGITALTRQIAVDYAGDAIRANSVLVGSVDTRITRAAIAAAGSASALALTPDPHALGRIAAPSEVAGVVSFLLSDDASFITASALLADGGLTATIL